ncbi:MAG: hypothetical protein A3G33_03400 [Omnitrophica bacterium RIFCSPLOWO2_12_FULL_44_17]|uniref:Type II secretion system protein GspG C-terminal domain-containing protein n=1 Tax=Candidatus Danuiimicrobium aquiferis TaxID=1801832 RepID=A0A1G1KTT1_9BACT|nr:MAG: hypothetical protein A3B72_06945 [Omnitrophica bacterium RIFCSPHIGHO2_02_FULL_45_28]OGW90179.1 MAG: hypothetical protein A3E74_06375 [Omnitrophica bacterium RIFCSPHIGHO2_12_FULL_44_12]OGW96363.1 MAG: hypothetical protein A3G33_03400 [Omnitrophica bacterium RIFCSPLOWO2_12_FULL_44_17]OGX04828.1 MAG: hypothetical protein A3J12_07730 [Omnitrophica bacterium RIFCSPLOWO2_02_FULL_44_11]
MKKNILYTVLKNKKKAVSGFTLAELLIVTVIVGILGIISMPKFYAQKETAKISEALSILSAIRQNERAYFLEKGSYKIIVPNANATDWGEIGMLDPSPDPPAGEFDYEFKSGEEGIYYAFATRTANNNYMGYAGKFVRVRDSDGKAVCSADTDHPLISDSACLQPWPS